MLVPRSADHCVKVNERVFRHRFCTGLGSPHSTTVSKSKTRKKNLRRAVGKNTYVVSVSAQPGRLSSACTVTPLMAIHSHSSNFSLFRASSYSDICFLFKGILSLLITGSYALPPLGHCDNNDYSHLTPEYVTCQCGSTGRCTEILMCDGGLSDVVRRGDRDAARIACPCGD